MLGPLAEVSPGNREIGRLGTCEVREDGRLEFPGFGRSSGLPPRALFFPPSPKKMGSESAPAPKSYYVPTPLVLGAETEWQGPRFPRVLRFSEGTPGILLVPETPPQELSAFSPTAEHGGFRGPLSPGDVEVGKSGDLAKNREEKITEDEGRRTQRNGGRRKMTDGERRK